MTQNDNCKESKDLQQDESGAYKPAYKENPKMAENQADSLSPDLAEIVRLWPELPKHIQAAIKALVDSTNCGEQPK